MHLTEQLHRYSHLFELFTPPWFTACLLETCDPMPEHALVALHQRTISQAVQKDENE